MPKITYPMADLVIAQAASKSNILDRETLAAVDGITIQTPDSLAGTIYVEASAIEKAEADYVDNDFEIVQSSPGTDLVLAAARVITLTKTTYMALRLTTGTPPGAGGETFPVCGEMHPLVR